MKIVKNDPPFDEREGLPDKFNQKSGVYPTRQNPYNLDEEVEIMDKQGKTRLHVYLTDENLEYVREMSRACGMSQTDFFNRVLEKHRKRRTEVYESIKGRKAKI